MTPDSVLAASFRDPSGVLFRRDGVLYRQVNRRHADDYDELMSSGLYEQLVEAGLLVRHEEVDVPATEPALSHRVLRPEVVPFISYPYEWCFGQLQDAALATLEIQRRAMDAGMSLRDASAFNIQFHEGRPVLIDTLSFEKLEPGRPWIAYRQFCQHFLAPLALMSYRDVRAGDLSRLYIDGVPLDLATRMLPARARLRMPLLMHLFLHARAARRPGGEPRAAAGGRAFTLQAFRGLIDSLTTGVRRMKLPQRSSAWVDYYADATHYSSDAMTAKRELVTGMVAEAAPASVWDLGANTGEFSRICSEQGIQTVAFEGDRVTVEENYRRVKEGRETHLLPLVLDLTNPSPALGWANAERMSLLERGPADLAMALALIHHLAIGNNVPFARIAGFLAEVCRRLVIEFVPKEDEKVQTLLATRDDIFDDYTRASFEERFRERFEIERTEELPGSGRVLYLMRTL